MWTLLIEQISGKPFPTYARDHHLAPMGLHNEVLPMSAQKRADDATGYLFDGDGKLQAVPLKESRLGLAAGGFMASGESLAKIMRTLQDKYTESELDNMGWSKSSDGRGRLSHNGLIDGGTAFVVIFPEGYVSVSGKNLSGVHVAIATNVSTDTGELDALASRIALAVADAGVPGSFDLWD